MLLLVRKAEPDCIFALSRQARVTAVVQPTRKFEFARRGGADAANPFPAAIRACPEPWRIALLLR